ncbi:MAG TPA: hypothetical protein VIU40_07360, partial [Geobacteraceae bacterium]
AVAQRGPAKIIIAPNLNTPEGVLDIQAPDGQRFRSGPVGLVVYSPVTGKSLQIGRVQDCEAWQTAKNEITFFDAFDGLKANVRFRNELGGRFHQEILLTRKLTPTTLARLGFSADLTREPLWIEVWSEFIECPEPTVETTVLRSEADPVQRAAMLDPDTTDAFLDFGATKLARGIAFSEANPTQAVTVFKRWLEDPETGHRFLVEACDYAELLPLLEPLEEATFASIAPQGPPKTLLAQHSPPSAAPKATTSQGTDPTSQSAASGPPLRLRGRGDRGEVALESRAVPHNSAAPGPPEPPLFGFRPSDFFRISDFGLRVSLAALTSQQRATRTVSRVLPQRAPPSSRPFLIAKLDPSLAPRPSGPSVTIDYVSLTGFLTNYVFLGDTTYAITSAVNLYGSNTFLGGAVLKFSANASISVPSGSLTSLGTGFQPVYLTCVDDHSAGEPFGTGSPAGYYANPALSLQNLGSVSLANLRFAYARQAIALSSTTLELYHAQFVKCQNGVSLTGGGLKARNALFFNTVTNFN